MLRMWHRDSTSLRLLRRCCRVGLGNTVAFCFLSTCYVGAVKFTLCMWQAAGTGLGHLSLFETGGTLWCCHTGMLSVDRVVGAAAP